MDEERVRGNRVKLYEALSGYVSNIGSFEEFSDRMENEGNRRKVFDLAKSRVANLGSWDEFNERMYSGPAEPSVMVESDGDARVSPVVVQGFDAGKHGRFMRGADEMVSGLRKQGETVVRDVDRMRKSNTAEGYRRSRMMDLQGRMMGLSPAPLGFNGGRPAESPEAEGVDGESTGGAISSLKGPEVYDVVLVDGEPARRYMLPDGRLTTDWEEANGAAHDALKARQLIGALNGVGASEADIDRRLEEITGEMAVEAEGYGKKKGARPDRRDFASSYDTGLIPLIKSIITGDSSYINEWAAPTDGTDRLASERDALLRAKKLLQLNRSTHKSDGFWDWNNVVNVWAGIKDRITSADYYDFGKGDLRSAGTLLEIKRRIDNDEDLSDRDISLLKAAMLEAGVDGGVDLAHGVTIGRTNADMVPFVIELMMNPASGTAKKFARGMVRKYGREGAKAMAMRMGARAVGDIVEAGSAAVTTQAARTTADAIGRHIGAVDYNADNDRYEFTGGENGLTAAYKAVAAGTIENWTEMAVGDLLKSGSGVLGKSVAKGLESMRLGAVSDFVSRVKANDFSRFIGRLEKKAHWNGTLEEILEEEVGIPLNTWLVGDSNLGDLTDIDRQIDIVLGVGLLGGAISGIRTGHYGYAVAKAGLEMRKSAAKAAASMPAERWSVMKNEIDGLDGNSLTGYLYDIVSDTDMGEDAKREVVSYALSLARYRGINISVEKRRDESRLSEKEGSREGDTADVRRAEKEASEAFLAGYDAVDEDYERIYAMYCRTWQRLTGMFGEDVADVSEGMDVTDWLYSTVGGIFTKERVQVAMDYLNASQARDGWLQRRRDNLEAEEQSAGYWVSRQSNAKMGRDEPAVVSATMSADNRKVFVVEGLLDLNDDGTISYEHSDSAVIVRDAETGELEFVDPRDIASVDEVVGSSEYLSVIREGMRERYAREGAEAMSSGRPLEPGKWINAVVDGKKTLMRVYPYQAGPGEEMYSVGVYGENDFSRVWSRREIDAAHREALEREMDEFDRMRAEHDNGYGVEVAAEGGVNDGRNDMPFNLNDYLEIRVGGGETIRGSVTAEMNDDGLIEVWTEMPVGGSRVNLFTPDELRGMIVGYETARVPLPDGQESSLRSDHNVVVGDEFKQTAEVNNEVVFNDADNEGHTDVPVETDEDSALSRIPVDEHGDQVFEAAEDMGVAWDGLVEDMGGEEDAKVWADGMVKRMDKAAGDAEKAFRDIPADGDRQEFKRKRAEARADLEAARWRADRWREIAGIKEARERAAIQAERERLAREKAAEEARIAEERAADEQWNRDKRKLDKRVRDTADMVRDCPEAVEMLGNMEPADIWEAAAMVLSGHRLLLNDSGVRRGTRRLAGLGKVEARKFFGLFASRENGGVSLEYLAEDIMKETCGTYGIPYENDAALDALMDVIQACSTVGEIRSFIVRRRIDQAKDYYDMWITHMKEDEARYYQERYHMSREELDVYEEELERSIGELSGMDLRAVDEILAEARTLKDKDFIEHEKRIDNGGEEFTGPSDGSGGVEILSGSPADGAGGGAPAESGGSQEAGGTGAGQNGGASAGASEVIPGEEKLEQEESRALQELRRDVLPRTGLTAEEQADVVRSIHEVARAVADDRAFVAEIEGRQDVTGLPDGAIGVVTSYLERGTASDTSMGFASRFETDPVNEPFRRIFGRAGVNERLLESIGAEAFNVLYDRGYFDRNETDGLSLGQKAGDDSTGGREKLSNAERIELDGFLAEYKSVPVRVITVDEIDGLELPDVVKDELRHELEENGMIAGYCGFDKKIYIFADRSPQLSLRQKLLHENIHAILDKPGNRDDGMLAEIRVSLMAEDFGSHLFSRLYDALKENYENDQLDEEFLAYIIQLSDGKRDNINSLRRRLRGRASEYFDNRILRNLYGDEKNYEAEILVGSGLPGSDGTGERHSGTGLGDHTGGGGDKEAYGGTGVSGHEAGTNGNEVSGAEVTTELLERNGSGSYSDEEVSYANDPVSKVMGRNRFGKKRQAEFAARERQRMAEHIEDLAGRMHLDNVEIVTDASRLGGKRARAKGFYNKHTGVITIVIPNNVSTIDAEQTLLHEAVAHYGLRQLFGEQFNTFLDNVYDAADEEIRRKIAESAAKNGWDFRIATEEYLAGLAEDIDFERAREHAGWWSRIRQLFIDMVDRIGFDGFRDGTGVVIGDNELRYILWRSYENLAEPGRYRSILGEAADVAMQSRLKVGNYAEGGIEAEYAAEPICMTNTSFNNQLDKYISGTLPKQEILRLGNPRGVLRRFLPDLPIVIRQRVIRKGSEKKHEVDVTALTDMPERLSLPVFVFQRSDDTIGILTDIKDRNGKNVCVAIEINRQIQNGNEYLEVNDVRSFHGREFKNIVGPIVNNNTLKWVDKEKGLAYLSSASQQVQQEIDRQVLEDAAKIVENFENPTIEDDVLFRPGDFTPRDREMARDVYNRICSAGGYQFKEAIQDSMSGLKALYRSILGSGTRIEDVAGFENAYLFENRMSSMNAGEQHEYFRRFMRPLLKEVANIAGADRRKRRELTDYLMAKHGLERNGYMRDEAAANGDETDRDFAGLMGLTGEADWRSAEATARQWVDDYEGMVDTTALWDAINKATKATLEKVYLSGIISRESYEKIGDMYEHYVPLRGWDETTSDQVYGYLMSNEGPLGGSIMKRAEGRSSKADDPIATIAMMADDAIRQGNRNLMKQHFLNFVLNHPSDVASVHDIWLRYDDVSDEWVPVFADVKDRDSADEVNQKVDVFEKRMEALRAAEPDKYKRGHEARNIPYKVVHDNLREHQVLIKRDGRTFVVTINGNPRAAQAINGLTNPDVNQNGVIGNMLEAGTWINRQLSAFYTTRNPDFVVGNLFRDLLYSNCMVWIKESPIYAIRFHRNFGHANPVVMRRLLGKWENGTLDMGDRFEGLFYQFMKNGGETGYANVRDIEGHKKAVIAELKKQGSIGRRVWTALGMQLDLLNRSAENCARFAAFVTSRELGRNIDRAIYDAKEISVNFNKKGSGGKMVNATGQTALGKAGAYIGGGGRLMYVFWNAGIQGMTNFGRQAKRHPVKLSAGAATLFALGCIIPMLAGDGDDDDKNAYYNLPEHIRRSNMCFRVGDQWISIPLPVEFRAMYGMGELAYGVISGNERYGNDELAMQMTSQVSQLMPIDMLEGGGGISPLIPSAAKPFTEAYIMNKGWTGLPVSKDTPFNRNDPEWTKAYASTDKHLVDFARWLNETSGGNDFEKGMIDINPAKLEYLLNGTFGGLISFPNEIKKFTETIAGDRELEWRNMPIANRLIKSGDERTAYRKLQNEYWKYKEEYERTKKLSGKIEKAMIEEVDENGEYHEAFNELVGRDSYKRMVIFEQYRDEIADLMELMSIEADKEKEHELKELLMRIMRMLVNDMHDPDAALGNMTGKLRQNNVIQ